MHLFCLFPQNRGDLPSRGQHILMLAEIQYRLPHLHKDFLLFLLKLSLSHFLKKMTLKSHERFENWQLIVSQKTFLTWRQNYLLRVCHHLEVMTTDACDKFSFCWCRCRWLPPMIPLPSSHSCSLLCLCAVFMPPLSVFVCDWIPVEQWGHQKHSCDWCRQTSSVDMIRDTAGIYSNTVILMFLFNSSKSYRSTGASTSFSSCFSHASHKNKTVTRSGDKRSLISRSPENGRKAASVWKLTLVLCVFKCKNL